MPTPSRLLGLCLLSLVACATAQRTDTSLRVRLHTAAYVEASPPTPAPTDTRCVDASGAPLAATHLVGARGRFCTLHAGGTVCCWGEVIPPEPGDTDDHDGWRFPHRVGSLPPGVTQVALGARHACARVRDGRVLCWGEATGHRLGSEGHGARESAVVVPGLAPAEDLLVTDDQSCVRTSDGSVRCWGGLLGGQPLDAPRQVSGLPTLTRFVQGPIPCGLDAGGTLVCWHNNGHIEVGPRTDDPVVRFPRLAPAATMALAVDAYDPHLARGCSVGPTGAVRCFGPAARDCEPGGCDRPVEGLRDVVSLAASSGLTCAAQRDGSAWCWGNNTDGAVGDGTTISRPDPTRVEGLTGITEVAVTAGTACALHADGTVRCWGRGARGALGNGALRPQHTPPPRTLRRHPRAPRARSPRAPARPLRRPARARAAPAYDRGHGERGGSQLRRHLRRHAALLGRQQQPPARRRRAGHIPRARAGARVEAAQRGAGRGERRGLVRADARQHGVVLGQQRLRSTLDGRGVVAVDARTMARTRLSPGGHHRGPDLRAKRRRKRDVYGRSGAALRAVFARIAGARHRAGSRARAHVCPASHGARGLLES